MREIIYIPVVVPLLFSLWSVDLLMTTTIWGEARGESWDGKIAVGYVIQNRVNDRRFGKTHIKVMLARKQFTCFNTRKSKRKLRNPLKYDSLEVWTECWKTAKLVLEKMVKDPTDGATHYHRADIEPYWAKSMGFTKQIGNHKFYREKNG